MSEKKLSGKNIHFGSFLLLLLFALAGLASAQIGNASLGGTVTDQSGASVAGAV